MADGSDRCARHAVAFYLAALPADLRAIYEAATRLEGLDEEITLLRVLVRQAAENNAGSAEFYKKYDLLIRAIGIQHRVSRRAESDLTEAILGVVRGVGIVMGDA